MNVKYAIKRFLLKKVFNFVTKKLLFTVLIAILPACGSSGGGITVQEVGAPPDSSPETSAVLTWDAPTTNDDINNSCITDHAGYNVYYGEESTNLANLIRNADAKCEDTGVDAVTGCATIYVCTYTVSSLTTGTWYFAVTSFDVAGNESEYSNEVWKEIY